MPHCRPLLTRASSNLPKCVSGALTGYLKPQFARDAIGPFTNLG